MFERAAPSSRRRFLRALGVCAAAAALPRLVLARTGGDARLIVVILRGALDGLAAVPPHGDPDYAQLHRELAIAPPGELRGALPLDGTFGLHPSLAFLHQRYAAGELIAFHAVCSPYRERSHFDGQNVLENGMTQPLGTADGWLNRALSGLPAAAGLARERAVALSQNVPLILRGECPVASKSPQVLPDVDEELLARLADLYSKDEGLSGQLSEAMDTARLTGGAEGGTMAAKMAAPAKAIATAHLAGSLMRGPGGPEIAVMEVTGWDTHANQGGAEGTLAQRLAGLDAGMQALYSDLQALWPRTAVLIVTEFGRTAAMNGTRGTDHGTGGCAFLLGGAVRGGRVVSDWPSLSRSSLLEGRDLRPTLDLRSVFKGVLDEHLRVDARTVESRVFPNSRGARPMTGLISV